MILRFWRLNAVSRQFVAPDGDDRNVIFTNAEEEVFIPECDLVLEMESPAGTSQETNGGTNSASSRWYNYVAQSFAFMLAYTNQNLYY